MKGDSINNVCIATTTFYNIDLESDRTRSELAVKTIKEIKKLGGRLLL